MAKLVKSAFSIVGILLTLLGPFAAQACFQPSLLSVYESKQGPMYQEFVGTVIRWTPTNEVVVLTVAHGVVGAKNIFGRCGDGQIHKFNVIKIDEDRDVAVLEPATTSRQPEAYFEPVFDFPNYRIEGLLSSLFNPPSFGKSTGSKNAKTLPEPKISLLHPFFKDAGIVRDHLRTGLPNGETDVDVNQGIYRLQKVDSYEWIPRLNSLRGHFSLQRISGNVQRVALMSDAEWDIRPIPNGKSNIKLNFGVRPGMSGSPVFIEKSKNMLYKENTFLGMVSKTKAFTNGTLLVPATAIDEFLLAALGEYPGLRRLKSVNPALAERSQKQLNALFGLKPIPEETTGETETERIIKNSRPNSSLKYTFNNEKGILFPSLTLNWLGKTFTNACDSDIRTTSTPVPYVNSNWETLISGPPITIAKGGDWGGSGGSADRVKKSVGSEYGFSANFSDSRYVPEIQCKSAGILDDQGKRFLAIQRPNGIGRDDTFSIVPIRNIDQLTSYLNKWPTSDSSSPPTPNFLEASQKGTIHHAICKEYLKEVLGIAVVDLIFPVSESRTQEIGKTATDRAPRGVVFRNPKESKLDQFSCDGKNLLHFKMIIDSPESPLPVGSIEIEASAEKAKLKLKLKNCSIEETSEPNGFEMTFRNPLANLRLALENQYEWAINIGQISETCGFDVDSRFKGAIRIVIPMETRSNAAF